MGRHCDKSLESNHYEFVASWALEGPDPPSGLLWGSHENTYVKVAGKLRDWRDGNVSAIIVRNRSSLSLGLIWVLISFCELNYKINL